VIDKNPILAMIVVAYVLAPQVTFANSPFTNVANHLAMFTIALTPPYLTINV